MGRILEYVVLLGNIFLIVGGQNQRDSLLPRNYEPPSQNFTLSDVRHPFKTDEKEISFNRKIGDENVLSQEKWPLARNGVKPKPNGMSKTPGLSSFISEPFPTFKRRNLASGFQRNGYYSYSSVYRDSTKRGYIPPHSQKLIPTKTYNKGFDVRFNPSKERNTRLTAIKSDASASKSIGSLTGPGSNYKNYQNHQSGAGRNPRFFPQRQNSKMCEPCNSVPWVPLPDVPSSYRKERKQNLAHGGKFGSSNYNSYDYHAVSSDTHNYVLPSNPLVPPTPTILDGTISSSYGLPVGNIPTSHGLLAPLNHYLSSSNSDYSTAATTFFQPPTLLDGSPIPELSPVPIVPVYDSGQFYTGPLLDSSDIGLVPPTTNSLSVSNVVFTISEDTPQTLYSQNFGNGGPKLNDNLNFKEIPGELSDAGTNNYEGEPQGHKLRQTHEEGTPNLQPPKPNFGGIEIVKSVPLAEFTTGSLSALVSQNTGESHSHFNLQNDGSNPFSGKLNVIETNPADNLVPPPPPPPQSLEFNEINATFNAHLPAGFTDAKHSESQYQAAFHDSNSALKPLTGPSATSWIFADAPVKSSGVIEHKPLSAGSQSIASIVNSEFQPIPSQVLPISQGTDNSKSKKVQIIIPYTTKGKNELDTNSFESVRQEVFQTLQSLSNKSELEYAAKFEGEALNNWISNKTIYSSKNDSNITFPNHRQSEFDRFNNPKYVTEMQHILAKNIRELLYREIEKSPTNQNFLLQNNIDNWTALEYSNHQILTPKQTKQLASQVLTVTSIPGSSTIPHQLLPSKKIPDEYFVSTKSPFSEDIVNSFLKTLSDNEHSSTPRPETVVTNTTEGALTLSSPSPFVLKLNNTKNRTHENNYTIVSKSRVNYWNKLNENLIVPDTVGSTSTQYETTSSVTAKSTPSFTKNNKIEIVTPVSVTTRKAEPTKRTTRHVRVTERTLFKRNFTRPFHRLKLPPPSFKLNNVPSTFRKQVNHTSQSENVTSSLNNTFENKKLHNRKSVNVINQMKNQEEMMRFGESSGANNQTVVPGSNSSDIPNQNDTTHAASSPAEVNLTATVHPVKTNQSEQLSINDIIPFRNKEQPWESDVKDENTPQSVPRQRKSLIKQVKSRRPRRGGVSETEHSLRPQFIRKDSELDT